MANVTKICKVCGKSYLGCTNAEKYDGIFRYQTVACSPECGAIYLARVLESRGIKQESAEPEQVTEAPKAKRKSSKKVEPVEPEGV